MARKAKPATPEIVAPEPPEIDDPETNGHITQAEAIRRALADGAESPEDGTDYIRKTFGIEVTKQRFSSSKSQIKKKAEATKVTIPRRRGRPRLADGVASTPRPKLARTDEGDLLAAMETLKPMIARLGADKLKRLIDLIG